MQQCRISMRLENTDYAVPLGAEVWIDDVCLFDTEHVDQPQIIEHDLDDAEADHELRIILKNKTPDHTQIDDQGRIIKDARLRVADVKFDQILLDQILTRNSEYVHDLNGKTGTQIDRLYGEMGCNGTVFLRFRTPVYVWLLENM